MYDLWTTEVFDNTVKIKESSRIFIDDECKGLGSEKFYSKKEQLVEEYWGEWDGLRQGFGCIIKYKRNRWKIGLFEDDQLQGDYMYYWGLEWS